MNGPKTESHRRRNQEVVLGMQNCISNRELNRFRKPLEQSRSMRSDVLFIGRNPVVRVYTDEILKRAGFQVHAITPWEVKSIVNNGLPTYPLVIFGNTMYPQEVIEIGKQLRRCSPASKLLLMLGPDGAPINLSAFDSVLEGLEGPAALVQEARRLTTSAKYQEFGNEQTIFQA